MPTPEYRLVILDVAGVKYKRPKISSYRQAIKDGYIREARKSEGFSYVLTDKGRAEFHAWGRDYKRLAW